MSQCICIFAHSSPSQDFPNDLLSQKKNALHTYSYHIKCIVLFTNDTLDTVSRTFTWFPCSAEQECVSSFATKVLLQTPVAHLPQKPEQYKVVFLFTCLFTGSSIFDWYAETLLLRWTAVFSGNWYTTPVHPGFHG